MSNPSSDVSKEFGESPFEMFDDIPMAAVKLWKGALLGLDGSGDANNLSGVARAFAGVADETKDNSAGNAGDLYLRVKVLGLVIMDVTGVDGPDDVNKPVYSADGNSPSLTGTSAECIGRVFAHLTGTKCLVFIQAKQLRSPVSALADSSGGTAGAAIAAGVGIQTLAFFVNLADLANGDVLTDYVPGYKFKILSVDFRVCKPATTAAKAATLNMEIGSTNLTGGVVALTSANCTPAGAAVAGSAVTAANTGAATDAFSIEAGSVTAFVEGSGWILVKIQNMDTADALASLAARGV